MCFDMYMGNQELLSFRLPSVLLRLDLIHLHPICQFAYILNSILWKSLNHFVKQLIHLLDVRSQSQSILIILTWCGEFKQEISTATFESSCIHMRKIKPPMTWNYELWLHLHENPCFWVELTSYVYKQVMQI